MAIYRASNLLIVLFAITTVPGMMLSAFAQSGPHRQLLGDSYPQACQMPEHPGKNPYPAQEVTYEMRQCFVEAIAKEIRAIDKERSAQGDHSITADFLREVFHDCGPGQCDGSLLLNYKELRHPANTNIDGPENIARLRKRVRQECSPHQISWADTIILSTAVGIEMLKGPDMRWDIPLGRGDSDQFDNVDKLPPPTLDAHALIENFRAIFPEEHPETLALLLVTLSGGHTIGDASCGSFRQRAKDGLPVIDRKFQHKIQKECSKERCVKEAFDAYTENVFDNKFFKTLLQKKGLLFSDQTLLNSGDCSTGLCTAEIVKAYANSQDLFFKNFKWAYCTLATLGTPFKCPYDWDPIH